MEAVTKNRLSFSELTMVLSRRRISLAGFPPPPESRGQPSAWPSAALLAGRGPTRRRSPRPIADRPGAGCRSSLHRWPRWARRGWNCAASEVANVGRDQALLQVTAICNSLSRIFLLGYRRLQIPQIRRHLVEDAPARRSGRNAQRGCGFERPAPHQLVARLKRFAARLEREDQEEGREEGEAA